MIWPFLLIATLTTAALLGLRLYTRMAVQQRRVVAVWSHLEALLTQRNAQIQHLQRQLPDSGCAALRALCAAVHDQERARRCGELEALALAERRIRRAWDELALRATAAEALPPGESDRTARRVAALDHAITDALHRYNEAAHACSLLARQRSTGLVARLAGCAPFQPVYPPDS